MEIFLNAKKRIGKKSECCLKGPIWKDGLWSSDEVLMTFRIKYRYESVDK